MTQESAEQTEAVDAPAEPESFGGLWLTEINPNDYDGYNKGKYGLTKAEDLFEYVELLNNSDQVIHFNQDYELLYNDTAITQQKDGRQVMVSYYYYNGVTDTKDKKSVNLTPGAEGPRMTASAVQQASTPRRHQRQPVQLP